MTNSGKGTEDAYQTQSCGSPGEIGHQIKTISYDHLTTRHSFDRVMI
jgi:hypothetical protein